MTGPRTIVLTEGSRAVLLCPALDKRPLMAIQWFRVGEKEPIYEYNRPHLPDAAKENLRMFGPLKHRPRPDWLGRAFLRLGTEETPALAVTNVQASDKGEYVCKAIFADGSIRAVNTIVHITATVKAPSIFGSHGEVLSGEIGPYVEGDTLRLICEMKSGYQLFWLWNSTTVVDGQEERTPKGVRSTLVVKQLTPNDSLSRITCRASNSFGVNSSTTVTLNVWTRITHVRIRRGHFSEGVPARVECEVLGCRPPPLVSWYLDDEGPLPDSFTHVLGDITTSVLTMWPTAGHNKKELICNARHPVLDHQVNDSFVMDVHYKPKLILSSNKTKLELPDEDLALSCTVDAHPTASVLSWYLNGQLIGLPSEESLEVFTAIHKAIIPAASLGYYACAARNSEGFGLSNQVHVSAAYDENDSISTLLTADVNLIAVSAIASLTSYVEGLL
ncbi:hemicentin-1-like [Ornithodoros turicata]|uniref:hemicentin-1-like n=1 Tax=Ornithodoros turicata TaxID=34597 RepID=UPI00313A1EF2